MFVLKEMLPSYHKWRYNCHGVREQIGKARAREAWGLASSLGVWAASFLGAFFESRLPDLGADSCYPEPVP